MPPPRGVKQREPSKRKKVSYLPSGGEQRIGIRSIPLRASVGAAGNTMLRGGLFREYSGAVVGGDGIEPPTLWV